MSCADSGPAVVWEVFFAFLSPLCLHHAGSSCQSIVNPGLQPSVVTILGTESSLAEIVECELYVEMMVPLTIQRIPHDPPRLEFVKAIEIDYCVIIQNFTDLKTLAQANSEVQPYLDAEERASTVGGRWFVQCATEY